MNQAEHTADRLEMYQEAEVVETQELEPYRGEVAVNLLGVTDPEEALTRFEAVATALDKRVRKRKLFTKMGKGEHLHVEAWTLLGSLLGVFPVPDGEPEPVEVNGVQGFKATVYAQTRAGERVGGGTAYCMRDEPTWTHRPTYALAGMAQTRAISRAMRAPLGFVAELAGYAATPAEEIPGPAETSGRAQAGPGITDPQHRKIGVLLKELNEEAPPAEGQTSWVDELRAEFGVKSRTEFSKAEAGKAIEWLEVKLSDAKIPFG